MPYFLVNHLTDVVVGFQSMMTMAFYLVIEWDRVIAADD